MSFILDALKKSENDRQQQSRPVFSDVPVAAPRNGPPTWLWVLGGLLCLNLAVLAGLLLRQPDAVQTVDAAMAVPGDAVPADIVPAPVATASVGADSPERDEFERRVREAEAAQRDNPQPAVAIAREPLPAARTEPSPPTEPRLADIDELRAGGELPMTDLRLDIHVYSERPADRFVFVNMVKYREGSTTTDGLRVLEITSDGVILDYRGNAFLLSRQ